MYQETFKRNYKPYKAALHTFVACMADRLGAYRGLVLRPDGKRPLRPRHGWEDNIKMHLQEVGQGGMDWIAVAQDRDRWRAVLNAVMNLWVL